MGFLPTVHMTMWHLDTSWVGISLLYFCIYQTTLDAVLGITLTEMPNFWSHLNVLSLIPMEKLKQQPVLSAKKESKNLVALPYFFDPRMDPYKFHSIHCFIYPKRCTKRFKLLVNVYNMELLKNVNIWQVNKLSNNFLVRKKWLNQIRSTQYNGLQLGFIIL